MSHGEEATADGGNANSLDRANPRLLGVGCLGHGRVPEVGKSRLRSGGQRLGCVSEALSQGFPCVTPVLRFKAQGSGGSGKDSTGSYLTCRGNLIDQRVQDSPEYPGVPRIDPR